MTDPGQYDIGCPEFTGNRAFCYTIQAAKLICSGLTVRSAKKLLEMAIAEIERHLGVRR